MKSDHSMFQPPFFKDGRPSREERQGFQTDEENRPVGCNQTLLILMSRSLGKYKCACARARVRVHSPPKLMCKPHNKQSTEDNVLIPLYISLLLLDENPWPAFRTGCQAREFKNRNPWSTWREKQLGKCQPTCSWYKLKFITLITMPMRVQLIHGHF